jgi:flagellar FliL protein
MAQADMADGGGDDDVESGEVERRSFKKILLIVLPVVLALIVGGGWLYVSGRLTPLVGQNHAETKQEIPKVAERFYYDLPEMLVDLRHTRHQGSYLKLRAALELERASDQTLVDGQLPVITDSFEVHLRELRVEDLSTPGALEALRSELLGRINQRLHAKVVKEVLFKEMLVGTAG